MQLIRYNNIIFYKLKNYDYYYISKCGKIYSIKKDKLLKFQIIKNYVTINLTYNKLEKKQYLHRLLAKQFILNLNNKSEINHIDGNKQNNNLDNLEWVTPSENTLHAYKLLLIKPSNKGKFGYLAHNAKKVNQYDLKGNFIKTWDCIRDVEKELKIDSSGITNVCKKRKSYITAGGFIWKYH